MCVGKFFTAVAVPQTYLNTKKWEREHRAAAERKGGGRKCLISTKTPNSELTGRVFSERQGISRNIVLKVQCVLINKLLTDTSLTKCSWAHVVIFSIQTCVWQSAEPSVTIRSVVTNQPCFYLFETCCCCQIHRNQWKYSIYRLCAGLSSDMILFILFMFQTASHLFGIRVFTPCYYCRCMLTHSWDDRMLIWLQLVTIKALALTCRVFLPSGSLMLLYSW